MRRAVIDTLRVSSEAMELAALVEGITPEEYLTYVLLL